MELFANFLDRIDRIASFFLDGQHAVFRQIIQVIVDDDPHFIGHLRCIGDLVQQTFPKGFRGDTRRVQALNHPQCLLRPGDILRLVVRRQHVDQRGMEIPPVASVQARNDPLGDLLDIVVDVQLGKLMKQIIIERLGPLERVGHQVVLTVGVFLDPVARSTEIVKRIGHVIAHVLKTLEILGIRGILANDQLPLVLGLRGLRLLVPLRLLVRQVLVPLCNFEHRILRHLLLDPLLKRLDRQLKDLHRLDHPRSQFLGLYLTGFESER